MKDIALGTKVKDSLTGAKGTVVARCEYLNGCVQFAITPDVLKEGVPQDDYWLDHQRLVVPRQSQTRGRSAGDPGGPQSHPSRNNPPSPAGRR